MSLSRRRMLRDSVVLGAGAAIAPVWNRFAFAQKDAPSDSPPEVDFAFGLVTYMWGADLELPALIETCQQAGMTAVELRTTHKHGVEIELNAEQREEVRQRFDDSGVTMVGIGSDERFDNPDPMVLKKAIERTKEFVRLSHDVGGTGVKVKPDKFHDGVPREKTIAQIAAALQEVGEYAVGFGQQIRLEVHGGCAEIPVIKQIMDQAKSDNVAICWNSNVTDLQGDGLEKNFQLVRDRFGHTVHVRRLDSADYPFADLMKLLIKTKYAGYVLLEAGGEAPKNRVEALAEQVELFRKFTS